MRIASVLGRCVAALVSLGFAGAAVSCTHAVPPSASYAPVEVVYTEPPALPPAPVATPPVVRYTPVPVRPPIAAGPVIAEPVVVQPRTAPVVVEGYAIPGVPDYRLGPPLEQDGLTIFPILAAGPEPQGPPVLVLEEAFAANVVVIEERSSGPTTNWLEVTNLSDRPILVLAGDILIEGYQDRIAADDVYLMPRCRQIHIRVYCIEAGRSHGHSPRFGPHGRMAHGAMRGFAYGRESQSTIWAEVRRVHRGLGMRAPTQAYRQSFEHPHMASAVGATAGMLDGRMSGMEDAVGMVAAVRGEVLATDLFGSRAGFRAARRKLLRSYAAEAAMDRGGLPVGGHTGRTVAIDGLLAVVQRSAGTLRGQRSGSAVMGTGAVVGEQQVGGVAGADGRLVHVAAVPMQRLSRARSTLAEETAAEGRPGHAVDLLRRVQREDAARAGEFSAPERIRDLERARASRRAPEPDAEREFQERLGRRTAPAGGGTSGTGSGPQRNRAAAEGRAREESVAQERTEPERSTPEVPERTQREEAARTDPGPSREHQGAERRERAEQERTQREEAERAEQAEQAREARRQEKERRDAERRERAEQERTQRAEAERAQQAEQAREARRQEKERRDTERRERAGLERAQREETERAQQAEREAESLRQATEREDAVRRQQEELDRAQQAEQARESRRQEHERRDADRRQRAEQERAQREEAERARQAAQEQAQREEAERQQQAEQAQEAEQPPAEEAKDDHPDKGKRGKRGKGKDKSSGSE